MIKKYISSQRNLFNKDLKKFFDSYRTSNILQTAMWYSLSNGGKRLRPIILAEVSRALGLKKNRYLNMMLATELIHCYSLVHDDLPSMDDDDYRRGKLSTHKKFNEAQAILSGNGLLTLAFELLSKKYDSKICHEISKVSGAYGLAGGQSIDISLESKKLTLNKVLHIHELKTAKLFEFCVSAPFIDLGDTNKAYIARKYGNLLGRSFQIIDDIIDQDQDEDNKNILNYMSKDDALLLCNQYKVRADKYLNKLFTKKGNKLSEIFSYIIEQADI